MHTVQSVIRVINAEKFKICKLLEKRKLSHHHTVKRDSVNWDSNVIRLMLYLEEYSIVFEVIIETVCHPVASCKIIVVLLFAQQGFTVRSLKQ